MIVGPIVSIYPDIGCPTAGQTVEPGTYACLNCPHDDNKNDKATIILHKKENYLYVLYVENHIGLNFSSFL